MRFILTVGLGLTFSPSFRLFMGCFVHVPLSQFQPSPAPLTHVHTQFPVLWAFSHSFLALARRTQSSISDAKKRNSIPSDWIITLFRKLGANPDWLETGTGPMYLRTDKGYGASEDLATVVPEHMADPQANPVVVPVYSTQCRWDNDSNALESDIIGRLALPRSHAGEHIKVYKTESDALAPFIRKGAYVGIDTAQRHPISGETFAVAMPPEGVVFRKLWLQPGSTPDVPGLAVLRAESPDYPESAMSIDDFSKVVIGRLVWVLQSL